MRPNAKFWWKNYWTGSCQCTGCSGSETDIFVVCADHADARFALHIEVKQPTDRFDPAKQQGERYRLRAACWACQAPARVPPHNDAETLLLCSKEKLNTFANEVLMFDTTITFEDVAANFPAAVPETVRSAPPAPSRFEVGDRISHPTFGSGEIAKIDGNKLEIDFDSAGRKRVMDSFVTVG